MISPKQRGEFLIKLISNIHGSYAEYNILVILTSLLKQHAEAMLQCNYKEEEVNIVMLTAIVVTVSVLGLAWSVGQRRQYQ